jgi:lysozyme
MGRRKKKGFGWVARALAAAVLAAVVAGSWGWWHLVHWTPAEADYPDQGLLVGEASGTVNFRTARALGADFVYLAASEGTRGHDAAFSRNLAAAREAGLQVGAVHRFDACAMADGQSANFVTMVPRGADLLPPAIELVAGTEVCADNVPEAAVASELMTLVNQIEMHAGKPAILKLSEEFEAAHPVARRLERNLWLTRDRFEPDYAGRPWLLWSANTALRSDAADAPLEWIVARP